MSLQKSHEETYKQIKKRLGEYRYRSGFLKAGTMIFASLFVLSLFPLVPVLIAGALGVIYSQWSVAVWFLCIGIFGVLFWICQRFAKKMEEKRGITFEERMYAHAYEAFNHLREYVDPIHPIMSGKLKAERQVLKILTLLGEIGFPNATLVNEEAIQLRQLTENLRTRFLPSMKSFSSETDSDTLNDIISSLLALVDYLSKPELPSLVALNEKMTSIPVTMKRSIYDDFRSTLLKRSTFRHVMVFSFAGVVALSVSYIDLKYLGASQHEAFTLGVGSWIALVTLYVTYLGLTLRGKQKP